jgi:RNA polymerase sigma-70 factor (ECF subfamily)
LLRDYGEAEDMVQETFLRAYEKVEEFRGDAKFSTWLYRICRNLCLSRLEHTKKYASDGLMSETAPDPSMELSEHVIGKERQQLVNWALFRLKLEFREVVLLYHTHYFSYQEIATLLGHPVGTVRSRLHRGREELKELLRPYLKDV